MWYIVLDLFTMDYFFNKFDHMNSQGFIFGLAILLLIFHATKDLRRNLPPGPWGLPVVGILPFIGNQPQETFAKLAHRYGPVFSGYLGSKLVVFVNDFKSMRQMFAKSGDTFNDRPKLFVADAITHGKGLVSGYLHLNLKEKRRFSMKILRSFGMGKSSFESKIVEEINYLKNILFEVSKMESTCDPKHLLENAISNVTCGMVFGKRYEYNDSKFKRFLDVLYTNLKIGPQSAGLNFIPLMRFLPGSGWKTLFNNANTLLKEFIEVELEEHKRTLDVDNPRDFIDEFLKEKLHLESSGENTDAFDHKSAIQIIAELFLAGTETTATTLKWALLYLALHPDIQNKVHRELDDTIGIRQPPTLKDQSKLVYCEAVIMEIMRMRPAAALGVPHSTVQDTVYEGYHIPKDTTIIPNIWAVMNDEKTWTEPEKFWPERFIDDETHTLIKREEVIPFSIGRRACPGEQLARMELFLFFTHLLYHFRFTLPPGKPKPSTYPYIGAVLTPKMYELVIKRRLNNTL